MPEIEKIKTIIVDDEPYARKCIKGLLENDDEIELTMECRNGFEAIEVIKNKEIDLAYLDVQMPEVNGFDVLSSCDPGRIPSVVFVTAYDTYVLKALKCHALDYLLKPFSDEEFYDSLKHSKAVIQEKKKNKNNQHLADLIKNHFNFFSDLPNTSIPDVKTDKESKTYLTRLPITVNNRLFFVNVKEIEWIEADDNYVKVHTSDKSYILRETMNELEEKLNPKEFFRIHRSTIINVFNIKSLEPYFKGDYTIILNNGKRLKLTRNRKNQFKEIFDIPL
jgi:two-component system, LytTR family, response regulator